MADEVPTTGTGSTGSEPEETPVSGTPAEAPAAAPTADAAPAVSPAAGVAAAETTSDAAEKGSRRKRSRASTPGDGQSSRKRTWITVVIAVVIIAALAALSYWAYDTIMERRLAAERLARATQLVEDADVVVIEVDEIVRTPIEASVGVRADAALDLTPGARGDLEEAMSLIALAKPVLRDEDVGSADALAESADARLEMLEHGEPILEANSQAAAAMEHALAGWDLIIEAEKLSDDAVKEYNKLTDASVKQSKKVAAEGKTKAEGAKTEFESAAAAFPDADFSGYIAYAEAKAAALEVSIKADDAYLSDRPTDANTFNNQYNDAEKNLIALAKALPDSPVEPIKVAYEALAAAPTEAYFEARDRATESDAQLQGEADPAE